MRKERLSRSLFSLVEQYNAFPLPVYNVGLIVFGAMAWHGVVIRFLNGRLTNEGAVG